MAASFRARVAASVWCATWSVVACGGSLDHPKADAAVETVDATESDSQATEDVGTAESAPADVNEAEVDAKGDAEGDADGDAEVDAEGGIDAPSACPDSSARRG